MLNFKIKQDWSQYILGVYVDGHCVVAPRFADLQSALSVIPDLLESANKRQKTINIQIIKK